MSYPQYMRESILQSADLAPTVSAPGERRTAARYAADAISVRLRMRGRVNRHQASVLDFNRHGAAMLTEIPLPKDQVVYLRLDCGGTVASDVVGIVHNCVCLEGKYRCGVRFRTGSRLQVDGATVDQRLEQIEARLAVVE